MGLAEICVKIDEKLWHFLRSVETTIWDSPAQFQSTTATWIEALVAQGFIASGTGSWELKNGIFTLLGSPTGGFEIQRFSMRTTLDPSKWVSERSRSIQLMESKQSLKRWEELTMLLPHNFEECNSPPWTQLEDYIKQLRIAQDKLEALQRVFHNRGIPRIDPNDTMAEQLEKFIAMLYKLNNEKSMIAEESGKHEDEQHERARQLQRENEELIRQRDGAGKAIEGYMASLEEADEQNKKHEQEWNTTLNGFSERLREESDRLSKSEALLEGRCRLEREMAEKHHLVTGATLPPLDALSNRIRELEEQYKDLDKHCASIDKARNIAAAKIVRLHDIMLEHKITIAHSETEITAVARYVREVTAHRDKLEERVGELRHENSTLKTRLMELGEPTDGLGTYPGEEPSKADQLRDLHLTIIKKLLHKLWHTPSPERVELSDIELVEKAGELIDSLLSTLEYVVELLHAEIREASK